MSIYDKYLIPKEIKDGTLSDENGLTIVRREQTVLLAPKDGDIEDTVELFQVKFRSPNSNDSDEDSDQRVTQSVPCILPSGWGKRLHKPGPVYIYSKIEILQYNEVQYLDGKEAAKLWADRRWYERDN